MTSQGFTRKLNELNVSIISWDICELGDKIIGPGFMNLFKGTCRFGDARAEVVFKMHRNPINKKTRQKSVQAVYTEMENEISRMHRLSEKDHILQLYGVTFKDLSPVMITESWVDDLQSYLQDKAEQNKPVDYLTKLGYCIDVLQGIQALHDAGFVHGDLMASSIVLVKTNSSGPLVAKIADLGSSYALSSDGANAGTTTIFLAPERMYTFRSKYPELARWERLSRQDIFGLGLLIWQIMMNGEYPYTKAVESRMRPAEVEEMRLGDTDMRMLTDQLPEKMDVVPIIQKATKLNPIERADLAILENLLKEQIELAKILFRDEPSGSGTTGWTLVIVNNDEEILARSKTTMREFEVFVRLAGHEDDLPSHLSNTPDNVRHWVFLQSQESASRTGSGNSQFLVACCYNWGFGVGKSKESTYEWLLTAARSNNHEAQCMLGDFYLSGVVMLASPSKAIPLFEAAADAENGRAMYLLGLCYYDGEGVGKDHKKAFDLWKKAADAGITQAKNQLGPTTLRRRFTSVKKIFNFR